MAEAGDRGIEEAAVAPSASDSMWASLVSSTLAIFDSRGKDRFSGIQWTEAVRRAVGSVPMRRLQECILGKGHNGVASGATIWLLGVCYRLDSSMDEREAARVLEAFVADFSSRIWITYRKGFDAIGQSKLTSDQGWGCMIRSGQMLCAQALLHHHLSREWRRGGKPYSPEYLDILHSFGDSPSEPFSIHSFVAAGSPYGLAAGSWIGPYALCRAIEAVAAADNGHGRKASPIAVYVVSGDAEGERGGAPALCIDNASALCSSWDLSVDWSPLLILVPLVLGLDKINPRYLPSLRATFSFPQSLGIAGGKPSASTYIVGVQEDQAIYLDPHEVQKTANTSVNSEDNLEDDTSSYHCDVVRRLPLETIDPSLALGFYCRDRDEFDDLCSRASELATQSDGAPMFTVSRGARNRKLVNGEDEQEEEEASVSEEDWQIL